MTGSIRCIKIPELRTHNLPQDVLGSFNPIKSDRSFSRPLTSLLAASRIPGPLDPNRLKIKTLTHKSFTDGLLQSCLPESGPSMKASSKVFGLSFTIIDWRDANHQIRTQVKEMWPKRITTFTTEDVPQGDRIICITEGEKLVGCVALEQLTITEPASLVQQVGSQKVYKLDIQIHHAYQNRGYGRTVFNKACSLVAEEGSLIFLVDMAAQGVGDRLYGGKKTLELFDVHHVLKGNRGEYLLKGKSQLVNKLNYLKIDPSDNYVFSIAVESPEGMNHLMNYLRAHPEDISLIDPSIIRTCETMIKFHKDLWDENQLTKYAEDLYRLRTAFLH